MPCRIALLGRIAASRSSIAALVGLLLLLGACGGGSGDTDEPQTAAQTVEADTPDEPEAAAANTPDVVESAEATSADPPPSSDDGTDGDGDDDSTENDDDDGTDDDGDDSDREPGDDDDPGADDGGQSSSEADREPASSEFVRAAELGLEPSVVDDALEQTLDLATIDFAAVIQTVAGPLRGQVVRSGRYDTVTGNGTARLLLDASDGVADLAILGGALQRGVDPGEARAAIDTMLADGLEYRMLDRMFWQRLPGGADEFAWVGIDADDFAAATGSDPVTIFDAATYLLFLPGPSGPIDAVADLGDGWTRWQVEVEADLVAPLAAGSGTVERLFAAGFSGITGLLIPGTIDIDDAGLVRRVDIDTSAWWLAGYEEADLPIDDVSVTITVQIDPGEPFDVELPCDDPEIDSNGTTTALVCEP